MIIYKNVDYGIYAYQIGFFKVRRIGEIVWSDQYDSKNEKFYLRIEGFYFTEEMVDRTKADNEMRYDVIVKRKRRKFLYRTNFFSYL